jgi:hypothetical protein
LTIPAWPTLVAYQVAWIACVGGGARGWTWPGALGAALVMACAATMPGARGKRVAFALQWAALGAACDLALAASGWLQFPAPAAAIGPLPVWMALLWLSFAPCLPLLARWLAHRPVLAAALGALGGPLAYLGAVGMDAVRVDGAAGWLAIAVEYGCITPLAARAAARRGLTASS